MRKQESGDCLASCIQVIYFCAAVGEDLRTMVGCFVKVCRRRGLKVNADKIKVMLLGGVRFA